MRLHTKGKLRTLKPKLIIFGLQGTLTNDKTLLKHVSTWLRLYRPQQVAIATNQDRVGLRYWMEPRPDYDGFGDHSRLPTEDGALERVTHVMDQIREITGGLVTAYTAFRFLSQKENWSPAPAGRENDPQWSKEWRKPGPGMLLQAASDFELTPADCLFVSRADDRATAEAASMPYQDEADFFGLHLTVIYRPDFVFEWLEPYQRIGLSTAKSLLRFEDKVRSLLNYTHVTGVSFNRSWLAEDDGDFRFSAIDQYGREREPDDVIDEAVVIQGIGDLDINRHYLVYASAQEHAEALCDHPRFSVTLVTDLMAAYGLPVKEAAALIRTVKKAM